MREMLRTIQAAYDYPVDVEFTANFVDRSRCRINLLQCRPFQYKGGGVVAAPPKVEPADLVLSARGAVIGQGRQVEIGRLIYIVPEAYGQLTLSDRHNVARLIGRIAHAQESRRPENVMLLGPGRWGTTTPSLGVPVSFAEIDTVSVLCEIVAMREDLVPDVSLGTHFFNDLVEWDMLYLALFPARQGNAWNREFFETAPNRLLDLVPDATRWTDAVRVIDFPGPQAPDTVLKLAANSVEQQVVCYLERPSASA
jgi:hypothetical protein